MEERRTDGKSRDRIGTIERRYDRFANRVLQILLLLTLSTFGFGGLSIWLALQNDNRERVTKDLVIKVRNETVLACRDQNRRHDRTITVLNQIAAETKKKTPKRSAVIDAQIKQSVFLIDALVPKQNCSKLITTG